jgi:subfamily B ATP-binding cassette protein MsbA
LASVISPQLKRLLAFVWPYRFRMALGVILLMFVALAEGAIALLIAPIVDRVLNPASSDSTVPFLRMPFGGHTIYLNRFFPPSVHNVKSVVIISMLVVFLAKSFCEFAGSVVIQSVGHRAITELRNKVYERVIRQPIGFFQQEPAGRLISAVINDV